MQLDFVKALQISALFVIGWALYRDRNARALTKAAKVAAMDKFRRVNVPNDDPRLHFEGATARVLKVEETGLVWNRSSKTYTLALWAENHCGKTFHVRVNAESVLVKHVPENLARVRLDGHDRLVE
jgi:hypothetical protein